VVKISLREESNYLATPKENRKPPLPNNKLMQGPLDAESPFDPQGRILHEYIIPSNFNQEACDLDTAEVKMPKKLLHRILRHGTPLLPKELFCMYESFSSSR
jgi:hypothetical protein